MSISRITSKYPTGNIYKIEHNSFFDTQFKLYKNNELVGYISYTQMISYIENRQKGE